MFTKFDDFFSAHYRKHHFLKPLSQNLANYSKRSALHYLLFYIYLIYLICHFHTTHQVHLTRFELESLRDVIIWLKALSPTKKAVPKDIPYPLSLLADAKQLLSEHASDDPSLALTGEFTLKWMQKKVQMYTSFQFTGRQTHELLGSGVACQLRSIA